MATTLVEMLEKLKRMDEVTIMEILEISTEDLLDRFVDRVEEKFDYLEEDLNENQET